MKSIQNAVVIHSPHSGRSAHLAQALVLLEQAGVHVAQTISIAELDELPTQGANWQATAADIAIAAGGDGLVGGVIAHIAESGLPLGILPLGTANDIARTLHIPMDISQAVKIIAQGKIQEIDIGTAQPAEQAPHASAQSQDQPVLTHVSRHKHGFFAHVLTVGLNVQFAHLATNVAIRQRYGRMTYPLAAIEVLRNHEALAVELHFTGLVYPQQKHFFSRQYPQSALEPEPIVPETLPSLFCRALQVTVINAPLFGGQWQLTVPAASVSDGLLDIVVIEDVELSSLSTKVAQFFNMPKPEAAVPVWKEQRFIHHPAELTGIPGMHHFQAQGVAIQTNADPRDVTLDGEVRGQTPMYVRLAPERLRVVVPQ